MFPRALSKSPFPRVLFKNAWSRNLDTCFDPFRDMAHFPGSADLLREVQTIIDRSRIPFICGPPTPGDGSCFFHAVMDQISLPRVRDTLPQRAANIYDYRALRNRCHEFMANCWVLHQDEGFKLLKSGVEETESWEAYLKRMLNTATYADTLFTWCTAVFLGKTIMLASDSELTTPRHPWTPVEGSCEGTDFQSSRPPLTLGYLADRHYQSIRVTNASRQQCRGCYYNGDSLRKHLMSPSVQARGCRNFYDLNNLFDDGENQGRENDDYYHRRTSKREKSEEECNEEHTCEKQGRYEDNGSEKSEYLRTYNARHVVEKHDWSETESEIDKHDMKFHLKQRRDRKYYDSHKSERREYQKKYNMTKRSKKEGDRKEEYEIRRSERRTYQNKYNETHRSQKQENERKRYASNRSQMCEAKKLYDRKNSGKKKQKRKDIKIKELAYDSAERRFYKFEDQMRDSWCFPCICCHRIMSSGGVRKLRGKAGHWEQQLKTLETELNKKRRGLYEMAIHPPDEKMAIDGNYHLCTTCSRDLRDKKRVPRYSYKNGLEVEEVPPELKLTDLEQVLIAKKILFLKIYAIRTGGSGMPAIKAGKTVNVPILDEDLLKTLNTLTELPRKSNAGGVIPVCLKRKVQYKNKVLESMIRPDMLVEAVKKLKELGHPGYKDIQLADLDSISDMNTSDGEIISGGNTVMETNNDEERTEMENDSDDYEDPRDGIIRNQYDLGDETCLTADFPESDIIVNETNETIHKRQREDSKESFSIAPGEGKMPTSLMRDETYDVDAFPILHPSGRYGLNHKREFKITPQEYFKIRLQNFDRRWSLNKAYMFSALYYIERHHYESQINVSCQRGKLVNESIVHSEDAFSVFDNAVGTPRYWQKKRYEIIAKLEQLGAFHFFFTLSCADKRWTEGFVSIFRQRGVKIQYESRRQHERPETSRYGYLSHKIWVEDQGKRLSFEDYMKNENVPDLVKENVLALTMTFDKRLHSFINNIAAAKGNPMRPKHYHYRVEFQGRGAPHSHGVLWVDIQKHDKTFRGLQNIMRKLQGSERLDEVERQTTADFVDEFITCSLKDEDLKATVEEVQTHGHKPTCRKYGTRCRFGFPRYPSEKTIIAQPLYIEEFGSEDELKDKQKNCKTILKKVKDVLLSLEDGENETLSLVDILERAEVDKEDYEEALGVSMTGTSVILKRTPAEMNINNYNEEWLKAWNGNMDLQVTLDFFAVITYITDYYTKAESRMTKILKEAAKACAGLERKDHQRYMVQAFMDNREMGESEGQYRMFAQLHLSESDLSCKFVSTGFFHNRSKFFVKVKRAQEDENIESDSGEDNSARNPGNITIPGRAGKFIATMSDQEKYSCRPLILEEMCLAQFATNYDKISASQLKKDQREEDDQEERRCIISWNEAYEIPLPYRIQLLNGKGNMRLRQIPKILRMHNFHEMKEPHEYFFSELMLYRPWRSEDELHPGDMKKCIQVFNETDDQEQATNNLPKISKLQQVKTKIFPYKNNIEMARTLLEHMPDQRAQHIGDLLDPEFEQDNEKQDLVPDEEYAVRDPTDLVDTDVQKFKSDKSIYKNVDISNRDAMLRDARQLDEDQRVPFDLLMGFVRGIRKSEHSSIPRPKAPLLKVTGDAGCGKTKLINVLTAWVEFWCAKGANKDPSQPHVVRAAYTGRAAIEIEGTTIHSAFKLPFGNAYYSLSTRDRENMKVALENLTLLIIDEMSMVKADMLYQLSKRLQELRQCKNDFGGVSVMLCGDLLQLQPIRAAWIFEEPRDEGVQVVHAVHPLWEQFQSVVLTKNHRQGDDKTYAELLRRVRKAQQTEEDIELLRGRVYSEFPSDALHVYGKNAAVDEENDRRMALLDGKEVLLTAQHINPYRKNWKPTIKGATIANTAFHNELRLKVGARVMMVYNIDITDELINGTTGVIVDFIEDKDKDKVTLILVDLDRPSAGKELRKKERGRLAEWGKPLSCPIGPISFSYELGKPEKGHSSSKVKLIQFPLAVAFAMTCHKFQGMTVRAPTPLVVDMASIWNSAAGMAYVMLSRIQNIHQLYLKSFDETKIKANDKALAETDKMTREAINHRDNRREWMISNCFIRKIVSLNITSLPRHLEDLRADPTLKMADIICLQETFCNRNDAEPKLPNYTTYLAGGGRGRGVAIFVLDKLNRNVRVICEHKTILLLINLLSFYIQVTNMEHDFFQGLKISFPGLQLINIYRSPNPDYNHSYETFVEILKTHIDAEGETIVCGDFNFDYLSEGPKNPLTKALRKKGLVQIVTKPTHWHGSCIDHMYTRLNDTCLKYELYSPYYTDHDALLILLKRKIPTIQDIE